MSTIIKLETSLTEPSPNDSSTVSSMAQIGSLLVALPLFAGQYTRIDWQQASDVIVAQDGTGVTGAYISTQQSDLDALLVSELFKLAEHVQNSQSELSELGRRVLYTRMRELYRYDG